MNKVGSIAVLITSTRCASTLSKLFIGAGRKSRISVSTATGHATNPRVPQSLFLPYLILIRCERNFMSTGTRVELLNTIVTLDDIVNSSNRPKRQTPQC